MNRRGSVLLIGVLVVAAISVIIAMMMFKRSQDLVTAGKVYRAQIEADQIQHELRVIFASPKLCEDVVQITGNTFELIDIYKAVPGRVTPLRANSQYGIAEMLVEDVTTVSGTVREANFSIVTQDLQSKQGGSQKKKITIRARYSMDPATGLLEDCRVIVNPSQACLELGYTWDSATSRCQICEKMGGTVNSDSVCVLPGGGS